jgi:hypothetical protein
MQRRFPIWFRQRQITLLVLLPFLLAGCSVLFVSPYDEMTDRAVSELVVKTETFLARYAATTDETTGKLIKRGKAYDDEAARFYNEARGAAAAILLRSSQKDKNEEEIQMLKDLAIQYDKLEASHRLGTIDQQVSASGLHTTLRAILRVQLTKKRIGSTKKEATASGSNP